MRRAVGTSRRERLLRLLWVTAAFLAGTVAAAATSSAVFGVLVLLAVVFVLLLGEGS
jgi:fatty acid desaturase